MNRALIFLALCLAIAPAQAADVRLKRAGPELRITTDLYKVVVRTDQGGRITSCTFDDAETTGIGPLGRGGLLEDFRHNPNAKCRWNQRELPGGGLELVLRTRKKGALHVTRQYTFYPDRPAIAVRLTFENHSPFTMSGRTAPALRCLISPAGRYTGRELFCLDEGGGPLARSAGLLGAARRMHRPDGAPMLRWLAVAAPAARRTLGIALRHDGSTLHPQSRMPDGRILLSWQYPALKPGHRMVTGLTIALLPGFDRADEITERFAAQCHLHDVGKRRRVDLRLRAFSDDLRNISLVTRAYGAAGKELAPWETLMFDRLPHDKNIAAVVTAPAKSPTALWTVSDLYSGGKRAGRCVAVAAGVNGRPPQSPSKLPAPPILRCDDYTPRTEDADVVLTPADRARGFVPVTICGNRMQKLNMHIAAGRKRTAFIGLRALRAQPRLRIALAGNAAASRSIPPAAVYIWHVRQADSGAPAELVTITDLEVKDGQFMWLAVTVDATQLPVGLSTGRIIISAGDQVAEIPLHLEVVSIDAPPADTFPLWYLGDGTGRALPAAALARLADSGSGALTLPPTTPIDRRTFARTARRLGFGLLAFSKPDAAMPPTQPSPGLMLLAHPQPVWLTSTGTAPPGSTAIAARLGYAPALLADRLEDVCGAKMATPPPANILLFNDGVAPGIAPKLCGDKILRGSESLWLHMDLRRTDWRRAVVDVRSALWAAAWQGLAGVAVTCEPPRAEAGRHLVIWHILRDARQDAALWRHAVSQARAAGATVGQWDSIIGTDAACLLRVRPTRMGLRTVCRAQAEQETSAWETAHNRSLAVLAALHATPPSTDVDRPLYWRGLRGLPGLSLVADRRALCTLVALPGEVPLKAAVAIQSAIRKATDTVVPIARALPALPDDGRDLPRVIFVIGTGEPGTEPPAPLAEAVAAHPHTSLVAIDLRPKVTVVLLRDPRGAATLINMLSRRPHPFATADGIR